MMWNLIVKSHVDVGLFDSALLLYRKMRELGVAHDSFTFPIINRAVSMIWGDVKYGEIVHCVAIQMGFGLDVYFCNTLIEVYVKCGCIGHAGKLFDEMPHRDLVSWTSMISGFGSEGNVFDSFKLFHEMRREFKPNSVTVIVMLQVCCASERLIEGRQFHGYVIKNGLLIDWYVKNSIFKIYTKLGCAEEVEYFFSQIDRGDVVSWNILISFYSSKGDIVEVAEKLNQMQGEVALGIETLTLAVSAFAKSGYLYQGENMHCLAIKTGLLDNVFQTSLLDFYAKCGELGCAVRLFRENPDRNNITWSAMMSGLIENGLYNDAINLFHQMHAEGIEPESDLLRSLIDACAHLGSLRLGKGIHAYLLRNSFYKSEEDDMHSETSILNMYIRCGSISSARLCFNRMVIKDIVTWTSMIDGYGTHGHGFEALKIFDLMLEEGIKPNSVTLLSLLSACSHSGLVSEGCEIFYCIRWKFGIEQDVDHYTCVVDLLGRSGKLKEALVIILKMLAVPDSRIWGALLAAARVHGNKILGDYAARMLLELEPDSVGYYTLLSNVKAGVERWAEVEEIRRVVKEKDLKKKPGWSCIEAKGGIHGFVSGDRSHHQAGNIYEVLGCLNSKIQEF